MKYYWIFFAPLLLSTTALAKQGGPDWGGPNHWPANITFTHLKNEGIVDNDSIDTCHLATENEKCRDELKNAKDYC